MQNYSASDPVAVDRRAAQPDDNAFSRVSQRLAHSEVGVTALSLGESTVVPIPLEAVILPLMLAWPRRSWAIATAALVGALIGASLFYAVGNLLFEPVVQPLLQRFGLEATYQSTLDDLSQGGYFWTVFLISVGPAPLQLATLGAGASELGFLTFFAAITASRAIRYFGLALLCRLLGERIKRYRVPKWVTLLASLAFLVAFWLVFSFLV
ncbi:YqaA family protein [Acuticoccus sp. I52.16.1]|uniref:YqaA family protein n=1 Tax=Acuticoccus sp. I52.16.1 TaxID=2928472 RepID=UPI001FD2258A|nr:VTT domain-containing protein [Acuticoccus sp. I52.16.1]UOM33055.1 VTT domain-containing protein [Acuticoccus sp. I52.16.1]